MLPELNTALLEQSKAYHGGSIEDKFKARMAWGANFKTRYSNELEDEDELYEQWAEMMTRKAEALADAGEQYLNENYPGWQAEVNPDDLDMASGSQCILGQMFGDYDDGIRAIWEREDQSINRDSWAREHGFLENGAPYTALDLAWRRVLTRA